MAEHLTPAEQAYRLELAALNKMAELGIYREYTHETTPNGSKKWTLKRKRSLTEQNLERLNKQSRNLAPPPPPFSPTFALDHISPTGNTDWPNISLDNLLSSPHWSDVPPHPHSNATDNNEPRAVLAHKAYLRARAGLITSAYSPWDYVSNGMPPQFHASEDEKFWWETHNAAYFARSPEGEVRRGYVQEWNYDAKLRVWYRQVKVLGEERWVPGEWMQRWVESATGRRTKAELGDGVDPKEGRAGEELLGLVEDVDDGHDDGGDDAAVRKDETDPNAPWMQPVLDETGLSFVRWEAKDPYATSSRTADAKARLLPLREPMPDSTGLSFVGWRSQGKKRLRPLNQPPLPPRKRQRTVFDSAGDAGKENVAGAGMMVKKAREISPVVVDEAGLSVVGWGFKESW